MKDALHAGPGAVLHVAVEAAHINTDHLALRLGRPPLHRKICARSAGTGADAPCGRREGFCVIPERRDRSDCTVGDMMNPYAKQRFSVVIPTLQRSPDLWPLVEQCAKHPLVHEVIVINNAPNPLHFQSESVRILDQHENIYVNPAWNLGAAEAKGEWLAIINDDVSFDDELLEHAAERLRSGRWGIIGIDGSFMNRSRATRIRNRIAAYNHIGNSFGSFMCLHRDTYSPIPSDLLIFGGDDWLFLSSPRPNLVIQGARFDTEVSATTRDPEFQAFIEAEYARARSYANDLRGTRWWHRPVFALETARRARWAVLDSMSNIRRIAAS